MSDEGPMKAGRLIVSIRAKLVVALLLTCVPMVFLVGWFGLESATNLMRTQALRSMRDTARLESRPLEDALLRGTADARFLSRMEDLHSFAKGCAQPTGPSSVSRQHVLGEFASLGESAGLYSSIRYVDAEGRERAGVDFDPEGPRTVPHRELQNLRERPYFQPALRLPPGAVFVSPIALDREKGQIQRPLRPMIHFVAPVVVGDHTLGLVLLGVEAEPLLPRTVYEGGQTFLVEPDGYYLSHTDPSKAWSGPRNLNTGQNLRDEVGSGADLALQPLASVVPTPTGVIATYPIAFGPPQSGNYVVLGVEASEKLLFAGLEDYRRFFWGVFAVSFVAPALAGLALATFFLRPVRKLRRAVHAVAEGNLDTSLDVRSGDEFQLLAEDFNVMAARLREYRQQERLALIGRMAAGIIHDLKNPLSSLTVSTRLLTDKELPEDKRREVGERILAQVDRVLSMLQEILEFSRTGKTEIEKRPEGLKQLVTEMEYGLTTQCAGRGITLTVADAPECIVEADREKLQRALSNIALNACEAMEGGGSVSISAHCDGDGVSIQISDTGPGIPPEVQERLFEPFTTFGKAHGTGLGLAITRAIIEAHGGHVEAHNRPEGGATFTIWLPYDSQT